jgi:hypothetical protein
MDPGSGAGVTFGVGGYYLMIYRICGTAVGLFPSVAAISRYQVNFSATYQLGIVCCKLSRCMIASNQAVRAGRPTRQSLSA